MGVPIDGPALMLGDNKSVILSMSVPSPIQNEETQHHHVSLDLRSHHRLYIGTHSLNNQELHRYLDQTTCWTCIPSFGQAIIISQCTRLDGEIM